VGGFDFAGENSLAVFFDGAADDDYRSASPISDFRPVNRQVRAYNEGGLLVDR
jgi:hypothetical protein